ncbi:stalk domain-containing protein [Paenibacillus beijingensis]|uniref:Copper amine oxidase-like N-terminal domain-containing protein n=1 Tax=Paenibacillus beijingensis TaxID=1126833 RepID=A0A0D5NI36_9BACL|nr:stalk domain-containing protein [Paenibacillus beijingensis]AJY74617.1 hypothetical protein VN24_08545 [Paenibacillus beijingensis]
MTTKRFPLPLRLAALGIAGSLILTGASAFAADAASSSNPAAETGAPSSQPVQSKITVTTKTVEQSTETYTAKLKIPVISGMADTVYQKELNSKIYNTAMNDLEAMKQPAQVDYNSSKEIEDYTFHPYELVMDYEMTAGGGTADNYIFSLVQTRYIYTGGAHGMTVKNGFNVTNSKTAAAVTLKSLFGSDYKSIINKKIAADIAKNSDQSGVDSFTTIADDQPFYVKNGAVQIVFQPGEIGPYAAGMLEFTLPIPQKDDGDSADGDLSGMAVKAGSTTIPASQAGLYMSKDGVAMAPLRLIASALGYTLKWDQPTSSAELTKGNQWTSVTKNKDYYTVNKMAPITLGTAPIIDKTGKMYVPLSFFNVILNAKISYGTDSVTITLDDAASGTDMAK